MALAFYKKIKISNKKQAIYNYSIRNVVNSLITSSADFSDFERDLVLKIIEKSKSRKYCRITSPL